MITTLTKETRWLLMLALAAATGAATAALEGRDINGNAVAGSDPGAVFLYDTDRDLTWARNAKVDAPLAWSAAKDWTSSLVIGSYGGWRLPTTAQPDGSCSNQYDAGPFGIVGLGNGCTGSEMGHLWHVELGNVAGGLDHYGDFQNLRPNSVYWSSTVAPWDPGGTAFYFGTGDLGQGFGSVLSGAYVLAVRDGDVLAIPEPGTYAMWLAGLGLLAVMRARRRSSARRFSIPI